MKNFYSDIVVKSAFKIVQCWLYLIEYSQVKRYDTRQYEEKFTQNQLSSWKYWTDGNSYFSEDFIEDILQHNPTCVWNCNNNI